MCIYIYMYTFYTCVYTYIYIYIYMVVREIDCGVQVSFANVEADVER